MTPEQPPKGKQSIGKKLIILAMAVAVIFCGLWKYSSWETSQLFGRIVPRVKTDQKVVALTLDDGPTSTHTDNVLRILQEQGVKATFYLTGAENEKNLDAAKKIVAAGHELGNHSYSHSRMIFKSLPFVAREIETTTALMRKAGFQGAITFRPPFGKKLFSLPYYLADKKIPTIMWDVAPDSRLPRDASPKTLVDYTVSRVRPGSIILMHVMYNSRETSRAAIPKIITHLRNQGYTFVTISELLKST